MHLADFVLLAILVVLLPAWELWRGPGQRARLVASPELKVSTYQITCIQLWTLALYGPRRSVSC